LRTRTAEVLDYDAGEKRDGVEVGFGFGDGYDFCASEAGLAEGIFKGVSYEATTAATIKTDSIEVLVKPTIAGEDNMAGAAAVGGVVFVVFWRSIPVPNGEVGTRIPGSNAAEAEDAGEVIEIDDRVGAKGEEADIFVESSAHGQCASTEIDGGVVVDGVFCCDEEGAASDIDDRAVAKGASSCGLEGASSNRGSAVECCRSGEGLGAAAVFHEVACAGNTAAVGGGCASVDCEGVDVQVYRGAACAAQGGHGLAGAKGEPSIFAVKRRSLEVAANSGSMKLPLTRVNEFQSMRRVSMCGRLASRKARALSGSEKVDLTNLSWGW